MSNVSGGPPRGEIRDVRVATVRAPLPAPVSFGAWHMTHREFAVVRVDVAGGPPGWAFSLTRDGAVAAQLRATVAPVYRGGNVADRQQLFHRALRANQASHSSGVGLRALSLVDLALWDAAARLEDRTIADLLGGSTSRMPATVIVGYPPGLMGADETEAQVSRLMGEGWRRFKLPVASDRAASLERLRAARRAAPAEWIGCDGAWTFSTVDEADQFLRDAEDVGLGWFEDMFAPGDAEMVADLHRRTTVRIAMGDDQGGSYYPDALLQLQAVDVVRVDLTCMGGITGTRAVVDRCNQEGVAVAPHMFAHVHSQVLSAWGVEGAPIEWGDRWTGVDPYADSLRQPVLGEDGYMEPLQAAPGFGELVNFEWVAEQETDDPSGILTWDERA